MQKLLTTVWPRPERLPPQERAEDLARERVLDERIRELKGLATIDTALHLEAARRIADEENARKAGAESRATTFIAAVAALIPLMTWAIGNASPTSLCTPGWGCGVWTAVFAVAVWYFVTAAYWALRTLAVANFYVIGVEDLVQAREQQKDIGKLLIQETLLLARRNRTVINLKLDFIQVAQRRFFNGLLVLGILLMFDPVARLGVWDSVKLQAHRLMTPYAHNKPEASIGSKDSRQAIGGALATPPQTSTVPAAPASATDRPTATTADR